MVPDDVTCANITTDGEPLRRMANDGTRWVTGDLPQSAAFPTRPEIIPDMEFSGQWFSRPKITIPMGITPVFGNRIKPRFPESATETPSGERVAQKLNEAPAFLSKTGSEKDGQLALPTRQSATILSRRRSRAARFDGGGSRARLLPIAISRNRQSSLGQYRFRRGPSNRR